MALGAACRDVRPTAHFLSFASPKERKQRKGEPNASALRAHCVARAGREARKLAFGSNSARLFFRPTLRYSTPHNGRDSHTRHRFARHSFRQIQAVALVLIAPAAINSIASENRWHGNTDSVTALGPKVYSEIGQKTRGGQSDFPIPPHNFVNSPQLIAGWRRRGIYLLPLPTCPPVN